MLNNMGTEPDSRGTPGGNPAGRGSQPGPTQGQGQHILCVDDDEAIVYVTMRVLERLGYRVTGQLHPLKALEIFTGDPNSFDLVITDLQMPALSGPDLAREIRKIRTEIPIVFTSGCIRPEDTSAAEALGTSALIGKPASIDELRGVLARFLASGTTAARSGVA